MTVSQVVEERLRLMGTSLAQIAKEIGTNPTQMRAFLSGKGTLSSEVLERCLHLIGIDMSIYIERINKAQMVADIIMEKGITQIENLTKRDFLYFTNMESLKYLIDVSTVEEYEKILNGGLIDPESTFPYFKALVAYIFNIQNAEHRKRQIEYRKMQICNDIEDIDKRLDKITSSAAKSSLWGIFRKKEMKEMEYTKDMEMEQKHKKEKELYALEEERYMMESKSQKGSISLFSKIDFFSLNGKAMEYIRDGKI